MSVHPARRIKLTYEHYRLFPEDGRRHEIIDGDHYMSPSPITVHQTIIVRLTLAFGIQLENTGQGRIFVAPFDVVLSDTDVVQPDLIYVSREHSRIVTEKNIRGAPDLVIEVLSPGTEELDRKLKKHMYARFGVREYWIVDPSRRAINVFRLGKRGYGQPKRYGRKDSLPVAQIPGLVIDMRRIF